MEQIKALDVYIADIQRYKATLVQRLESLAGRIQELDNIIQSTMLDRHNLNIAIDIMKRCQDNYPIEVIIARNFEPLEFVQQEIQTEIKHDNFETDTQEDVSNVTEDSNHESGNSKSAINLIKNCALSRSQSEPSFKDMCIQEFGQDDKVNE